MQLYPLQRSQCQRQVAVAQVKLRQPHRVVSCEAIGSELLQHCNRLDGATGAFKQLNFHALPRGPCGSVDTGLCCGQPAQKIQRAVNRTQTLIYIDDLDGFLNAQRAFVCECQPSREQRIVIVEHGAQSKYVGQCAVAGITFEYLDPGRQRLLAQSRPFSHLGFALQPQRTLRQRNQAGISQHQRCLQVSGCGKRVPSQLQLLGRQGFGQFSRPDVQRYHAAQMNCGIKRASRTESQLGKPPIERVTKTQDLRLMHRGLPSQQRLAACQQSLYALAQQFVLRLFVCLFQNTNLRVSAARSKVQVCRLLKSGVGQCQRRAVRQIGHTGRWHGKQSL